jgi:hypothetical protein
MQIAEMEAHHAELLALEDQIAAMESRMDFPAVFQVCEESFSYVVPAISLSSSAAMEKKRSGRDDGPIGSLTCDWQVIAGRARASICPSKQDRHVNSQRNH